MASRTKPLPLVADRAASLSFPGLTWAHVERLVLWLSLAAVLIVLIYTVNLAMGHPSWLLRRFFDLNGEANIAAWFSSILLAIAGLAALACALWSRELGAGRYAVWLVVAAILFFMSCDEVAMIHEQMTRVVRDRWLHGQLPLPHGNWVALFGPGILTVFAWVGMQLRWCLQGSPVAAWRLLLGVTLFVGGSMVLELALNLMDDHHGWWLARVRTMLEEGLEMAGSLCFLSGLIAHLRVLEMMASDGARVASGGRWEQRQVVDCVTEGKQ